MDGDKQMERKILSPEEWNKLRKILFELKLEYFTEYDATCKPLIFNKIDIEPFQVAYQLREE